MPPPRKRLPIAIDILKGYQVKSLSDFKEIFSVKKSIKKNKDLH